ncbi:MAG: peptidase domain-containing ABC transporter [Treponema sp.]|jgi:ATP-binding cassette subfamily B protein|nr:peptidase domain-containing ABC transporter [Treponema sp.]
MKYQQQLDVNDCAPACLVMIMSNYNSFVSIGKIRKLCKTDYIGTNLMGMVMAAKKLGFRAESFRGEIKNETLNAKLVFPFIAHIKIFYLNNQYDHFVVIKEITKNNVIIWDPNPNEGIHKLSRIEFLKVWTGYVLFLSPDEHFIPQKSEKNLLIKFLPLVLPHRKNLTFVCFSSCLIVLFGIVSSFYYKYVIDEVIVSKAKFTLLALSVGVLLITIIQSSVEALRGILINHFAYKTDLQLCFSYIKHILKLPISFFDSRRTGEILSRLDDTKKIRETLSGTTLSIIMDIFLIIIIGPILFKINSTLFFISSISVFMMSIIIFLFSKLFRKYYIRLRHEEALVNSSLVETINGMYTIKALNAEQFVFEEYETEQMHSVWTSWKTSKFTIMQRFLTGMINSVGTIITFWYGSSAILKDTFSFGTLLSFNSLLAYFTGPLFRMINIQPQIQEASVAAERVSEILEMEVEQPEDARLLKSAAFEGDIDFSHVSFKYGMRPLVYKDLSFHINKGQWVAFVGPSGCGKTTLVKLILKFYEPEQGTVSIDNHDLRDIDATALRARIGYVPQDIYIFAGTIAENIALCNPAAPMEEIMAAAEKAGADEFINNLPARYNTKLSERGSTLSGGERQRLALARALLGKPDIMILDEATSNLDSVSERLVHQVIEKLRGTMTAIIIAHRLTTVRNCDTIFVMDKGDIVESGSHEELLAKNGLYKTLWEGTLL